MARFTLVPKLPAPAVMLMGALSQDLKLAARSLFRDRGVTVVAVASLAIGIAANATVFSLVQAVEFPRLIYPDAFRIVFLESRNADTAISGLPVSAPDALDIAASTRTLESAALTSDRTSVVTEGGAPERRSGRQVAPAFFDAMHVAAMMGRVLAEGDGDDVVVISERFWRTRLGSERLTPGRVIHLDDRPHTVIGVMPARFDPDADFWVMLPPSTSVAPRDDRRFTLFARLRANATLDEAARELSAISARLGAEHPETNRSWIVFPTRLTRMHGQDSRGVFFLLQGAVAVVLLIACANIANILLARGSRRSHEVALCIALGASRGRLLRQLLTESVLLAAAGGAIGALLSLWGIRIARALGGFPDVIEPILNAPVLAFTAAISMLTGVICGIVPALRASGMEPIVALRADGERGTTGRTRAPLRTALVALQVASAVVLATSACLMVQTLANRYRVDLGFNPRAAVRADLILPDSRYPDDASRRSAVDATLDWITRRPDIMAAGATAWAMLPGAGAQQQLTLPGGTSLPSPVRRSVEAVTPAYFDAVGVELRRGRRFTADDRSGFAAVAIVNDELARHLWPNRDPIGETLLIGPQAAPAAAVTVVGVVGSVRRSAMHDFVIARVYVPFARFPAAGVTLVARARGDVRAALADLMTAVRLTDPALVLDGLRTVDEDVAQFLAPVRFITWLLAAFGITGTLLAALGVFGTMTYVVSLSEREMAVRVALGAGRRQILQLVLGSGLLVTLFGVVPGVLASIAAGRALGSFLYGVAPADPVTLTVVVVLLSVVLLAACYRPASAAASVDPMTILRRS
jgi:putative ABC transport system permease protein